MRTIYKFPLDTVTQEIEMPVGAEVVHFDFQGGVPCLWAIVDPKRDREKRRFGIFGTGNELPERAAYVGTQQQGPFVWHMFELK